MTSNSIHKDTNRSSSPTTIVHDNHRKQSLLLSCCGSRTYTNKSSLLRTVKDTDINEQSCLFKRIQYFKAKKRHKSDRKQHTRTTSSELGIVNDHHQIDIENSAHESDEQDLNMSPPSTAESPNDLLFKCLHYCKRDSQPTSFFDRFDVLRHLNNNVDSYSFADIEVISSIIDEKIDQKSMNQTLTPKSRISQNLSSLTTSLSVHSTQSLLQKLIDKAQVLDEYYNGVIHRTINQPLSSLSSSSNSLLLRSYTTSRPYLHRIQSNDSIKKLSRKKYRQIYDSSSSASSRFNLYPDEDNILRELIRFNNDIDLILSRLEMEGEHIQQQPTTNNSLYDESILQQPTIICSTDDCNLVVSSQISDHEVIDQKNLIDIITMHSNMSELNIHLLLSNDIDRLREAVLSKLIKIAYDHCNLDNVHNHETITIAKLNKLPKPVTWKGKHVFGVPLRIYQQTTGHILPIAITNALQYIRLNAGKCDGLFRKPGVKSKIDRLRAHIEMLHNASSDLICESIKFDEYQPFVVADVIRQYFRELPECIIPPSITRLLCDLLKCVPQEEQLQVIRYSFLLLCDESREVLETILRFLLDISIRSGNNQVTCRNLARIFLPSVFQSFYELHHSAPRILWWKWKKNKIDNIEQENERLILEQCLMNMIINVDLLCRVPSVLSDELKLPSSRTTKRLDELIRSACNDEFHLKKFITKTSEDFLQFLSNTKFKNVPTNINDISLSIYRPLAKSKSTENNLPIWKCSIDIPNTDMKQIHRRILHEPYLWNQHFAEIRTVEKIDDDKDIVQYVMSFVDVVPVRSFCEFRFSKKVTVSSSTDRSGILIGVQSIDHLQNHFLPGSVGVTHQMFYYIQPSGTHPTHTTVTQIACVDYSGRSTQWYENVYGSLLAHNLLSLRDTFSKSSTVRV